LGGVGLAKAEDAQSARHLYYRCGAAGSYLRIRPWIPRCRRYAGLIKDKTALVRCSMRTYVFDGIAVFLG